MMLLYANPNVTAKRLNGETAIQDKKKRMGHMTHPLYFAL